VIEGKSGLRTFNLSAARAPTLMTYFLFRRALDAGARPDAIIIEPVSAAGYLERVAELLAGMDLESER